MSSAEREPIDEAIWFHRTLERTGLPFAGVVVNRVHHDLLSRADSDDVGAALRRTALAPDLAARVAENFRDYHLLARRDDRNIRRLARGLGENPLLLVPQLDDDVHDLEGLLRMHRYLFATEEQRERLIAELVASTSRSSTLWRSIHRIDVWILTVTIEMSPATLVSRRRPR